MPMAARPPRTPLMPSWNRASRPWPSVNPAITDRTRPQATAKIGPKRAFAAGAAAIVIQNSWLIRVAAILMPPTVVSCSIVMASMAPSLRMRGDPRLPLRLVGRHGGVKLGLTKPARGDVQRVGRERLLDRRKQDVPEPGVGVVVHRLLECRLGDLLTHRVRLAERGDDPQERAGPLDPDSLAHGPP